MRLSELLSGTQVLGRSGALDLEIRGIAYDSRACSDGFLFFAVPGSCTDGNRFVRQAVERGAHAILSELPPPPAPLALLRSREPERPVTWIQARNAIESMSRVACRFHEAPSRSLTVIGITGTNGKTTTAYLLESILDCAGTVAGVLGTVNHRLGGRELEASRNTTPLSPDLQRLLRVLLERGASHAVLEVSSHALALHRVDHVDFDAAVFTNLHRDHLDYHKTPEGYFQAKARLFSLLGRADSSKKRRSAFLNADDPAFDRLSARVTGARIFSYGAAPGAELRAWEVRADPRGTSFRLRYQGAQWEARIRLIGSHNVHNALAAAGPALWLGLPAARVLEGLQRLERVPGRLEPVAPPDHPFQVFVDFAHTDSALKRVLSTLRELPHRRILTVFGCGGDRDKTKRGPMGRAACAASDRVFVTSDNPRGEDPGAILLQIEAGIRTGGRKNYRIIPDRREAILEAVRGAGRGDIVLIAGKGHETTQILRDKTLPFDDREAAREALRLA